MFKGINPKAFLDTFQEWHALAIGFFEVLCPWPPRYRLTGKPLAELRKEHHYYVTGRAAGFVIFIIIIIIIIKVAKEALL